MKSFLIGTILSALSVTSAEQAYNETNSTNWAVLIAGSNSYYNYRHQADIAHAYQILTKMGGFPAENVIVMMYNDVVNASENPFPGQLFNEPGGVDVYGDIHVDYSGDDVTAKNFLDVITGCPQQKGPVLKSGPNDNVFIYYSDHGATGLVAMPTGPPLYSSELMGALNYMYNHSMYHELVFYLEACESGSMFDGVLPNNTKIFATTAATPDQSSYAYYYNETLGTYMADEYSIRWMQDSTNNWNAWESLITQFNDVAAIVKESQPQQYGDVSFDSEPIEDFEAYQDRKQKNKSHYDENWRPSKMSMDSRDVKLATLQWHYLGARSLEESLIFAELITEELENRLETDALFSTLIERIAQFSNSNEEYEDMEEFIYAIEYGHRRPHNFDCLKSMYEEYEQLCGEWDDYSFKYVNALSNLCEIYGEQQDLIQNSIQSVCA